MIINDDDIEFEINHKGFWFIRDELNDFCEHHPHLLRVPKIDKQFTIFTEIKKSAWVLKTLLVMNTKGDPTTLTFDNPEHELMFKLIY